MHHAIAPCIMHNQLCIRPSDYSDCQAPRSLASSCMRSASMRSKLLRLLATIPVVYDQILAMHLVGWDLPSGKYLNVRTSWVAVAVQHACNMYQGSLSSSIEPRFSSYLKKFLHFSVDWAPLFAMSQSCIPCRITPSIFFIKIRPVVVKPQV